MATYEITAPNGDVFDVTAPDDATEEQVLAYAKANWSMAGKPAKQYKADAPESYDVTADMSGTDKFLAGAGKAFVDLGRGAKQLIGMGDQAEIDNAKERDAALMKTGAGLTGNIAGNVAAFLPTAAIPGANTITGGGLIGAGVGALTPTATGDSRAMNMGLGAGGGAAGSALVKGVSRVLNPQTSEPVKRLISQGVNPTPGQILGGAANKLEQGLTSVPLVGDVIAGARGRATEQFNKAALNQVLEPLGKKVGEVTGRDAIDDVSRIVSQSYDDVLKGASVSVDDTFKGAVDKIKNQKVSMLGRDLKKTFDGIIERKIYDRIPNGGKISGEVFKEIESDIGEEVSRYMRASGREGALGDALNDVMGNLRDMLARTNPQIAADLKKVNASFARLARVQAAGATAKESGATFSPAAFQNAVKMADKSARRNSFARGNALMQELADDARTVLGANVPDSGTPGRAMAAWLLSGGLAGINPAAGGAALAGMAPYTQMGGKLMQALLTQRPELLRELGRGAGLLSPQAAAAGGGLLSGN
jgi:hypothetical protein